MVWGRCRKRELYGLSYRGDGLDQAPGQPSRPPGARGKETQASSLSQPTTL